MNQIKKRKKFNLGSILVAILFLAVACFCYFDSIFEIPGITKSIHLGTVFLGIFLLLFTYLIVFQKYKKTLGRTRFIFAFETLLFVLIILTGFLLPGLAILDVDQLHHDHPLMFVFTNFNKCLAILFLLHGLISLYIEYFKKDNIYLFTLYLLMFSFGCYGLNTPIFQNARAIILKTLSLLSFVKFLYLTFIEIKKMKNHVSHDKQGVLKND
ncbi:hypothetical protein J8J04_02420 ['Fragaria x ananassa' phyllody phytoplasma]|uniref:DUF998 domain-containing protein n=1 Tax='Fragaria x ananassa' phyllody phytoplasma TaxID=2358428 RepID=A0ABS5K3N2_9MOLU|nr:hypothetical protein ['Fragaria x ananassa' phyllody phytoplasma]MBS2126531.1 hypothetical protein ['Fragaria x ananassa' phyllody phytoplasma]